MRRRLRNIKRKLRKPFTKAVALTVIFTFIFEIGFPTCAFALTGGPSQPEADSFEPVGTSDMVDPFSGNFTYNIPLLNVDGYPVNLAYHAGATMDQEASWVGLGWNINAGVINRDVRGVPDDFLGDTIEHDFNMKENDTYGLNLGLDFGTELFGLKILNAGISYSLGVKYNNYTGVGADVGICPSLSVGIPGLGKLTGGYGITSSSDEGVTLAPYGGLSIGISTGANSSIGLGLHIGQSFNSRLGLEALTFGASIGYSVSSSNKVQSAGPSVAATATFNKMMPTYTPEVELPMENISQTGSVKGGVEAEGFSETVDLSAYESSQVLIGNSILSPSYGYMHADAGVHVQNAVMDFNREKDGVFNQNTPDLPLTNFTYDIYSVSGQGMSGSYRPFRSDIGHVFDPYNSDCSASSSVGMEVSVGSYVHAGVDWSNSDVESYSGDWSSDNQAYGSLSFTPAVPGDPLYEPFYFKEANEKSVDSDPAFFQKVGGMAPQRLQLDQISQLNTVATNTYASGLPVSNANYRMNRDVRNQSISMLTRSQLHNFGLEDTTGMHLYNKAPGHHIGQMTSLGADGKRYVYGIAAYNILKEEVTFATGIDANNDIGDHVDAVGSLVTYGSGDNSVGNQKGIDNYYSDIKTPPYAHSYLLTAVLSPDYVDADGVRGPSDGDLGTWTKFNYAKRPTYFNWRVPVGANVASYDEGLKSDSTDDKGNYVYGQKELWYLNSIETKNYIAVFNTQARLDGLGVVDKNGAIDPDTSHAPRVLNSISLYTKPNFNAHLANSSIPLIPIEVVHFTYDYELCPNVPNNLNYVNSQTGNTGKLTLKSVYFTYQNSYKGALSPYKFNYCYNNFTQYNFPYDIKAYNRWGTYKPNPGEGAAIGTALSTSEYPYVEQDKSTEDQYAAAWDLTDITLPSGGSIHVDFESNDYAYIQNMPATQMYKIEGAGNSTTFSQGPSENLDPLTDGAGSGNQNYYLYFDLQKDQNNNYITNPAKYFNGLQNIYFRFLMQIVSGHWEYVSGYAPPSPGGIGICSDGAHGYIQLQGVTLDQNTNGNVSPIVKTALQFARLYTPRLIWHEPPITSQAQLLNVLTALGSAVYQLATYGQGLNGSLYDQGMCTQFVVDKSWIRLNTAAYGKLGGGVRVKDIMMNDQWQSMTKSEPSFDYGQQYSYTLSDGVTSSGVASYEPQIGGDENGLHTPVYYSSGAVNIPDDQYYLETPFGESFFPSPMVGYSMVTVKNLQRQNVHRNATGSVVHEFYTTKDFPTITNRTDMLPIPEQSNPLSLASLFNMYITNYMTASEGYSIQLNDMNGKPKAQYVYQEDQQTPISSVQYYYNCAPYGGNGSYQLTNNVTVVKPDGSTGQNNIGVFFDDVNDFRQSETDNISSATMINLDVINILGAPVPIPVILPSNTSEYTRFRSCVNTKVIQSFGILDSTIVTDLGSTVKTENLAYDALTGDPLLTKTTNDYNDSIFNLTYPAYWYYSGMGAAYANIGVNLSNISFTNGVSNTINNASSLFYPGDELALTGTSSGILAWVIAVSGNNITAEYKNGALVNGPFTGLEVIRSGRRNLQSMDMADLTTLVNPINSLQSNSYQKVTQASAKEYTDTWSTYCNCFDQAGMNTDNPYVLGIRGDYRLKTSLLYLTSRDQSNFDNNTNIREDGTFNSFNPFYSETGGSWKMTPNNWTYTSAVTNFNPYGQEIEDVDALGRYSSATFGYNQTLPTAVAANSKYQEMGFDGFEDYNFSQSGCADNHLDVDRSSVRLDPTQAHTGRHSLLVGSNSTVTIGGQINTCSPVNPCNLSLCGTLVTTDGQGTSLVVTPQGGTSPYQFNWSGAQLYLNSNGYPALATNGSNPYAFTVNVTDQKGCTYNATVNGSASSFTGIPACTTCNSNISLCYFTGSYGTGAYVTITPSGGTGPYTITCNVTSGTAVPTVWNGHLIIATSDFSTFTATVTVTDANGCSYSTTVTGVKGEEAFTVTGAGSRCSQNCDLSACYEANNINNNTGYQITFESSGATAPFEFIPASLTDPATTASQLGANLVYNVTDNSSLTTGFALIDANGCVLHQSFTSSSGSASPAVSINSNSGGPCCNISTCYTNTYAAQGGILVLTAHGGSGSYNFTLPSNIQSESTVSNSSVVIDYNGAIPQFNYTVTDANTPSCNYSAQFGTSGGITPPPQCGTCGLSLCYDIITVPGYPEEYLTLSASGGSGSYTYIIPSGETPIISGNLAVMPFDGGEPAFNVTVLDNQNPGCSFSTNIGVGNFVAHSSPTISSCSNNSISFCYAPNTFGANSYMNIYPINGTSPYSVVAILNTNTNTTGVSLVNLGNYVNITYPSAAQSQPTEFTIIGTDANGNTTSVTFTMNGSSIVTSPSIGICQ